MKAARLRWPAINDDVDAEFDYWKAEFVFSAWMAVGFGVAAGVLIAMWPQAAGDAEVRAFVRSLWTLFVECAFWLGFLLGLLWGAAKRLGSALSGVLPWQPRHRMTKRMAIARRAGQWGCWFALTGACLWIAVQFTAAVSGAVVQLASALASLAYICFALAAIGTAIALAGREWTLGGTLPENGRR